MPSSRRSLFASNGSRCRRSLSIATMMTIGRVVSCTMIPSLGECESERHDQDGGNDRRDGPESRVALPEKVDRDLDGHDDGCQDHDADRSEEHTSELQSRENLVCRLLLEKKKRTRRK